MERKSKGKSMSVQNDDVVRKAGSESDSRPFSFRDVIDVPPDRTRLLPQASVVVGCLFVVHKFLKEHSGLLFLRDAVGENYLLAINCISYNKVVLHFV